MQVPVVSSPQPVCLIALDMDGTLLSSSGSVSSAGVTALHAALADGLEIVIATGRRHTYAMRQLSALGLPASTVLISSNGAVVRTLDGALLERSHMSGPSCERLFGALGEFRNALVVTFDRVTAAGEDERGSLVVEDLAELHASIGKWIAANSSSIEHVVPIEHCLDSGSPIQMMLCGTAGRMRRAEALLHSIPGVLPMDDAGPGSDPGPGVDIVLHRTEYPARDLSIVDILPAGASKGAALGRLAASRSVGAEQIMAVGDNWNDLPMLGSAGVPVLMGNAPTELRAQARSRGWWMAPTNDREGVALTIEAVLARNRRLAEAGQMASLEAALTGVR